MSKDLFRHTYDSVSHLAKLVSNRKEFKEKFSGAYEYAMRNGIMDDILPRKVRKLTKESVMLIGRTCKNRTEFYAIDSPAYTYACKHKLLDEIFYEKDKEKIKMDNDNWEQIKELCLRYKTLTEFYSKHEAIYKKIKHVKREKEFFGHMLRQRFSISQNICKIILETILDHTSIENDRTSIKPYEIDISFPELKIGFEYDGSFWHRNRKNIDLIKDEIALKNGVSLIRISEPKSVKENLDDKIHRIKIVICSLLETINHHTSNNISENDVMNVEVDKDVIFSSTYDLDDIQKAISSCSNLKEFVDKYKSYYAILQRLGYLHMVKHLKYKSRYP